MVRRAGNKPIVTTPNKGVEAPVAEPKAGAAREAAQPAKVRTVEQPTAQTTGGVADTTAQWAGTAELAGQKAAGPGSVLATRLGAAQ